MTDSEIVKQLIVLAYESDPNVTITLADCLDLYARLASEAPLTIKMDETVIKQAARMAPPPKPAKTAKTDQQPFRGQGAQEKRAILDRRIQYRAVHGLGCFEALSNAVKGALTDDQIRRMLDRETFPLDKWKLLNKAMDRCEGVAS